MIGWDYIAQIVLFLIYILCAMRDITKIIWPVIIVELKLKSILVTEGP